MSWKVRHTRAKLSIFDKSKIEIASKVLVKLTSSISLGKQGAELSILQVLKSLWWSEKSYTKVRNDP